LPFTYMRTQYLHHIHPLISFPHLLLPPTGINLQGRTYSTILFSNFSKKRKKKWQFCLSKIATEEISLWHFHAYMYYSLIWFISSIFLLFYFSPFLMGVSTSLNILYLFLYREYINHIHLNFLLLPSLLLCDLPLAWPAFHNILVFVLELLHLANFT
jgi:hypothetical protein